MRLTWNIFGFLKRWAHPPLDQQSDHDRLYNEAANLVMPRIDLVNRQTPSLNRANQKALRRGITLFEHVLELNSKNWPAMWLIGKAHQRLREIERAHLWFARSHQVNPDHPDVAREASITAMELGHPKDAIRYCERAITSNPNDAGLRANFALALLFSEQVERAAEVAADALACETADEITKRIVKLCGEVKAGKRPCPHHTRDIG